VQQPLPAGHGWNWIDPPRLTTHRSSLLTLARRAKKEERWQRRKLAVPCCFI